MDNTCDIVQDLLPLYVDGVCSGASRRMIDDHIKTCPACANVLRRLQDSACEDSLRREARTVMAPRKWRNRIFAAGCTLAAFLCVPASLLAAMMPGPDSGPWSWLALMAPALLVAASASLLPLRSRRYTGRWTVLGAAGSLQLFLMACCVYSAGTWTVEYTSATWLFAAASALLYVLSAAVLVPWAVKELPLKGVLAKKRRLAAVLWDVWFALLIVTGACIMAGPPHYIIMGLGAFLLLIVLVLAVAALVKLPPVNGVIRAGLCIAVAGNALGWLEGPFLRLTGAELNVMEWCQTARVIMLTTTMALGVILVAAGCWQTYRRSRKKSA